MISTVRNTRLIGQEANLAGALRIMHYEVFTEANGDRVGVRNVAVILMDGTPTLEVGNELRAAQAAQADHLIMYTIGITGQIDVNLVRDLSSAPKVQGQQYFLPINFLALQQQVTPSLLVSLLGSTPNVPAPVPMPDTSCK